MTDNPVETIHGHYARQATPEVWAEIDDLRHALAKCARMIRHAVGADVFIDPEHTLRLVDVEALAQRIEARSDETPKAVQPEGREPDGEAGAPKRCSEHSIHSSSGRG